MKYNRLFHFQLAVLALIFFLQSCKFTANERNSKLLQNEVLVELEDFVVTDSFFIVKTSTEGEKYVISENEGWIAFEVHIPLAGRYKTQVRVSSSDSLQSCWIEDYYDNKDDRTYNITGTYSLSRSENEEDFMTCFKDGSPLNKGVHKMKLHLNQGGIAADWIKFTLLKEHQLTPELLTQSTSGDDWVLVWSDEFEKEGLPDSTKWNFDIGDWGWGNGEWQYYTENRLENARIEKGNLVIEARKNDMGTPWTSTRLTTRGKVSFLYGKIEFRAKVPSDRGNWAAGWTLGDDYVDELSWPYCGEIDILESVGYEMDDETGNGIAHASAHSGAYYFKLGNQPTSTIPVKSMEKDYHIYGVEWTPDYIKAYVDENYYFTYEDNSSELSWPFNKAQNIILNLAIGGGWGGAYGMDESITSQKMIVDYVRVYELQ